MHVAKIFTAVIVLLGVLYAIFVYLKPDTLGVQVQSYQLPDTSLSFSYRVEPDGYRLDTFTRRADDDPSFVSAAVVMLKSDYDQLGNGVPREGPPSLLVAAYRAPAQSPREWAQLYPQFSNLPQLIGDMRDATIAGAPAVRYTIDGLYRTNMALVSHNDVMYVFAGAYLEENSLQHTDFESLLTSIAWK